MTDDRLTNTYSHDPLCPALPHDGPKAEWCRCELIGKARRDEKAKFQAIWATNLRLLEVRNYGRGYRDGLNGLPSKP